MKRKIVAIGGGRVVSPKGRITQTLSIDREIVRLAGKRSPIVLFIPTASNDNLVYCKTILKFYGEMLDGKVSALLLYKNRPRQKQIRDMIISSDIIYVGDGNTLKMMKLWRKLRIDNYLNITRKNDAVLNGLSVGALCWFRHGNSDSRKFSDVNDSTLIKVRGLDYVDAIVCPHYDVKKHRRPELKNMMKLTKGVAITLDNCTTIEIINDKYWILTSAKRKKFVKSIGMMVSITRNNWTIKLALKVYITC